MRHLDRYRTQFCFIAPASLLDRYASVSRTHLVLPQVQNPQYTEFYLRKRREGDLIILDNGAYEMGDSVDFGKMAQAIKLYNPQVAALPDFLLQEGEKTFLEARRFHKMFAREFPETRWMYIPQAVPGDLQGFKQWMYKGLAAFKPDWIGLPRALVTHIARGPNSQHARVDLVEELTLRGIKTHALGMANGDLKELDRLAWEGVCSCDSSCAIWRGVQGFDLQADRKEWDHEGSEMDFNWEGRLTLGHHKLIKTNMEAVARACGKEISWQ